MSDSYKMWVLNPSVYSFQLEHMASTDFERFKTSLLSCSNKLQEVTFTYDRITLFFVHAVNENQVKDLIKSSLRVFESQKFSANAWKIPICFSPPFSADLWTHFKNDSVRVEQYIAQFLGTTFQLAFYGFLPGFGYLRGLPAELHMDRKANPSARMPKGTVAVGGAQLGIYPQDSPGGWHGIGHCPVPWFDVNNRPPLWIKPTDEVVFFEIDLPKHQQMVRDIENKTFSFQTLCQ